MEEFFEKMTSHGTPVKYLHCNNSGEHQSKLQRACKKEKFTLEYTTLHTPQLYGVIKRRFDVIKEGALSILFNEKINDTDQKMMWEEAVHTFKRVRNSMATTGSTTIPFGNFYAEKPRSLVRSRSLEVLDTSLNRTSSIIK